MTTTSHLSSYRHSMKLPREQVSNLKVGDRVTITFPDASYDLIVAAIEGKQSLVRIFLRSPL